MPDQLPSDLQTGYSAQTAFDIKMDTARTLSSVLDRPDKPVSINYPSATPAPSATQGQPTYQQPTQISVGQALISKDPKVKQLAQDTLNQAAARDPYTALGVGTEIRSPYAQAEKYLDKKYGYDTLNPDTEDFYYRNDYMSDGFALRQLKNVGKFTSRVAVGAIDKLGEGLGYIGSAAFNVIQEPISAAITGKPTHFWADVADNAFSKLMQNADSAWRDRVTPTYKKAGFDEKGFFSKLGDATFWNDSVADGAAFMLSAMIPMGIASKAGLLVKGADLFGEASSLARGANAATKFITGGESWGEVAMSAFNTASESAFEAAGRYKDAVQELQDARSKGQNHLTDEQIQSKAGEQASSTFGWNMIALTASNAWEMKHIFKPIVGGGVKKIEAHAADILINETGEAGIKKYSLGLLNSRMGKAIPYYVKKGLGATIAEGFWEENIQNAIQRANAGSYNRKGDNTGSLGVSETTHSGFYGILEQYGRQTIDALKGNDRENAESIGLGGLIGIAGGSGKLGFRTDPETGKSSFFLGERRAEEAAARVRVADINNAYNARMTMEDLKNPDGTIDKEKLKAKMDAFQNFSARQHVLNQLKEEGAMPKHEVQMLENRLLNDYARGLARVGKLDEAIKRFEDLSVKPVQPGEKRMSNPTETAAYLTDLKNLYENLHNRRIQDKVPQGMTREDVAIYNQSRKDRAFDLLADRKAMQPTLDYMQAGITDQFQNLQNFTASSFLNEQVNKELAKGRATDYIQHHAQKAFYEARLKAEQNAPEFLKSFYQAKLKEANDQIKQIDEFLKEDKPEIKDGIPQYPDASKSWQDLLNLYKDNYEARAILEHHQNQNDFIAEAILHPTLGLGHYGQYLDYIDSAIQENARKTTPPPAQPAEQTQTKPVDTTDAVLQKTDNITGEKTGEEVRTSTESTKTATPKSEETSKNKGQEEKKPVSSKETAEAKKLDIERRRKLSLKEDFEGNTDEKAYSMFETELFGGGWETTIYHAEPSDLHPSGKNVVRAKTKEELINKVNEKYDAELAALEKPAEKPKTTALVDISKLSNMGLAILEAADTATEYENYRKATGKSVREFQNMLREFALTMDTVPEGTFSRADLKDLVSQALASLSPEAQKAVVNSIMGAETEEEEKQPEQSLEAKKADINRREKEEMEREIPKQADEQDALTTFQEIKDKYDQERIAAGIDPAEGWDESPEDADPVSTDTPPPPPVQEEEVPFTKNPSNPEEVIPQSDALDPNKRIIWRTVLFTSKQDATEATDESGNKLSDHEVLSDDIYDQIKTAFIAQHALDGFNEKYNLFIVQDRFPEIYPEGTPLTGQVIVVEDKNGNPIKVGDVFPTKYKAQKDLPLVFSFNKKMFQTGLNTRANIFAEKEGVTPEQAKQYYADQLTIAQRARTLLKEGKAQKIKVELIDATAGFIPTTTQAKVVDRFGSDFTISPPITQGVNKGNVKVNFGKKSFFVGTIAVKNTTEMPDVEDALHHVFPTKEAAAEVRDQYLNELFFTNENQFFTIDPVEGGYRIVLRKVNKNDRALSKNEKRSKAEVQVPQAVGEMTLNVSKKALESGLNKWSSQAKNIIPWSEEQYTNFIKGNLTTVRKKVTDSKGNLHTEPINAHFSFEIKDEQVETKEEALKKLHKQQEENAKKLNAYIRQHNEKGSLTSLKIQNITADLQAKVEAGAITQKQMDDGVALMKNLENKPTAIPGKEAQNILYMGESGQGTSIEIEIRGETGKEFLLSVDRSGKYSLWDVKKPDGGYVVGTDRPTQDQIKKLADKYIPKESRDLIDKWVKGQQVDGWAVKDSPFSKFVKEELEPHFLKYNRHIVGGVQDAPSFEEEEEDAANILSQFAGKKKSDINALVGNQETAPTTYDVTMGESTFTFDITSGRISQPFAGSTMQVSLDNDYIKDVMDAFVKKFPFVKGALGTATGFAHTELEGTNGAIHAYQLPIKGAHYIYTTSKGTAIIKGALEVTDEERLQKLLTENGKAQLSEFKNKICQ